MKLKSISIFTTVFTLLASTVSLYIYYQYTQDCVIFDLEIQAGIRPEKSEANDPGMCLDMTDFFVYFTQILPCLVLFIWAFFLNKKHTTSTTFKIQYWIILLSSILLVLWSGLVAFSEINDFFYIIELNQKINLR